MSLPCCHVLLPQELDRELETQLPIRHTSTGPPDPLRKEARLE